MTFEDANTKLVAVSAADVDAEECADHSLVENCTLTLVKILKSNFGRDSESICEKKLTLVKALGSVVPLAIFFVIVFFLFARKVFDVVFFSALILFKSSALSFQANTGDLDKSYP